MLMKRQQQVSPFRGMPVDDKGSASTVTSVTGETVQFFYSNSGTLTSDAGQSAGVAVVAQLAYDNVKNALGNLEATNKDTSLSFTSTAFTTEVALDPLVMENVDETTFANRLAAITAGFSNGQYCVDYSTGTLYGIKATSQTTLTSTAYKYRSNTTAGSGTITSVIPGVGATNLGKAEDAAHTSGDTGVFMLSVRKDTATQLAGTDADYAPLITNSTGHLWSAEGFAPVYENNTDGVAFVAPRTISSSTGAVSIDKSTALEASTISKASAGRIYGFKVRIDASLATGTYFWHIGNHSSLPADGAVALIVDPYKIEHVSGTTDYISDDWSGVSGLYCSTGITSWISTTDFTKTIGGAVTSSYILYS